MIQEPLAFQKRINVDWNSDHSTLLGKWQALKIFLGCFESVPGDISHNSTNVPSVASEADELNEKLGNLISEQVKGISLSIDYLLRELIEQIRQNVSSTTKTFECQNFFAFVVNAQQQLLAPFPWWSNKSDADTTRRYTQGLEDVFQNLFSEASDESFEDGTDSSLALDLERVLTERGEDGVRAIGYYIATRKTRPECIGEVLRLLGRIRQPVTQTMRRWILERELYNTSPIVRDAAGLGLSSLNDPKSIQALEDAISKEKHELLKKGFLKVLRKLQKR